MSWWSAQQVAELRTLWAAGLSARQISVALYEQFGSHVSRCAVIGKARRIGCAARAERKTIIHTSRPRASTVVKLIPKASLAESVPVSQRKQLFELRSCDCRWPYGEPGKPGFFFCGAEREPGSSYCLAHFGLSTGKTQLVSREPIAA